MSTPALGYKHSEQALLKRVERFKVKENHPMYGKTHTAEARNLISKPGNKNPMYGRKHTEATKILISNNKNKYPFGVAIYDLNCNLIKSFNHNVELAKYLNVSKVTVGKYIKTESIFRGLYYLKVNEK